MGNEGRQSELFSDKNARRGEGWRLFFFEGKRPRRAIFGKFTTEKPFSLPWERTKSTCIFFLWKIMARLSVFFAYFCAFCGKIWRGKNWLPFWRQRKRFRKREKKAINPINSRGFRRFWIFGGIGEKRAETAFDCAWGLTRRGVQRGGRGARRGAEGSGWVRKGVPQPERDRAAARRVDCLRWMRRPAREHEEV